MKGVQTVLVVIMSTCIASMMLLGIFLWEPISSIFNVNARIVYYSVATFSFLAIPYVFFTKGSGLKSLFIGTGKTLYVLISSAVVNLGIYIPMGNYGQDRDLDSHLRRDNDHQLLGFHIGLANYDCVGEATL